MCYDYDLQSDEFENEVEEIFLDVPTHCPKCGCALELDTDYDKTTLICSNDDCDYEFDATEEFERASAAFDALFEDDSEED